MNKKNLFFVSALCFAATSTSALYAQDMPKADDTSAIPMLSGGVGDDEMAQLKSVQDQYNLKLLFTAPSGEYLSDVPVKIIDSHKNTIVDTVASGPVFLATLPPGQYTLEATRDDNGLTMQRITVSGKTLRSYQIRFPAKE